MDCKHSISNFDLSIYLVNPSPLSLSLSKYYSCFGISETRFSGQSERDRETIRTFRIVNFDREKSPSRFSTLESESSLLLEIGVKSSVFSGTTRTRSKNRVDYFFFFLTSFEKD